MDTAISAYYSAQLTIPFDIDLSLEQFPCPMAFEMTHENRDYTIEVQWGPDDVEWNDEHGTVKTMRVDIRGQGIVLASGMKPARIDESTFQAYERVFVDVIRKYITWVRVKTGQSWLDDRFAAHSYDVRFYYRYGSLIEEHSGRNPNPRYVSLHPDDAYSGLSSEDWTRLAEHFNNDDTPPRLERLLVEARALLAAKFYAPALVLVVSALEELERMWLAKSQHTETQKQEFTERRLIERIREIALKKGLGSKERRLLSRMISIRHDHTHKKFVEPKERDIVALIHISRNLARRIRGS